MGDTFFLKVIIVLLCCASSFLHGMNASHYFLERYNSSDIQDMRKNYNSALVAESLSQSVKRLFVFSNKSDFSSLAFLLPKELICIIIHYVNQVMWDTDKFLQRYLTKYESKKASDAFKRLKKNEEFLKQLANSDLPGEQEHKLTIFRWGLKLKHKSNYDHFERCYKQVKNFYDVCRLAKNKRLILPYYYTHIVKSLIQKYSQNQTKPYTWKEIQEFFLPTCSSNLLEAISEEEGVGSPVKTKIENIFQSKKMDNSKKIVFTFEEYKDLYQAIIFLSYEANALQG